MQIFDPKNKFKDKALLIPHYKKLYFALVATNTVLILSLALSRIYICM